MPSKQLYYSRIGGGNIKKIVLGYDETEESQQALKRAAQIAKAFDSELVVTSVARIVYTVGVFKVNRGRVAFRLPAVIAAV